jgi:hypothetical protein
MLSPRGGNFWNHISCPIVWKYFTLSLLKILTLSKFENKNKQTPAVSYIKFNKSSGCPVSETAAIDYKLTFISCR